jgi:hypothetical protein
VTVDAQHPEIVIPTQPTQSATTIKKRKTTALPTSEKAAKQLYFQLEQENIALMDKLKETQDKATRDALRIQLDKASDRLQELADWLAEKWGFDCDDAMDEDFFD